MKKLSNIITWIFAVGVLFTLFAGAATLIGFVVAMFIGGDTAAEICRVIHKEVFPWIIRLTSVFAGLGLVSMYLVGSKALAIKNKDK